MQKQAASQETLSLRLLRLSAGKKPEALQGAVLRQVRLRLPEAVPDEVPPVLQAHDLKGKVGLASSGCHHWHVI